MTSVEHDITQPSAGSFTLHPDAKVMEGHRDGRAQGGRGSYEVYHDQRTSLGELTNRRSPNLGQAPGCPGSLSESAQKVEELSRQLSDAKARENKMMQTITDLQCQDGRHQGQQAYGMHGNQGQQGPDVHSHPREPFFYQAQEVSVTQSSEIHGRDIPPRPHKSVVHSYVNMGGTSCPLEDPVGENVKDGHIKHLQRQVTILQANLYKAEELRNRASEAMKERDSTIDELRVATNQLSNAKDENESLKRETESLKINFMQIQQQLRQTCQELDVERSKGQGHNVTHENLAALRDENQALKVSLTKVSQENGRLRELISDHSGMLSGKHSGVPSDHSGVSGKLSAEASDHSGLSGSSACSNELEYLHQVVDTLKRTVLEQRKFLVSMKENPTQINGHAVNGRHDQMSAMSKSSSAALGSDLHKQPAGFRPGQVTDTHLPPHSGQGDSQFARQKPPTPRPADRNPTQENGSVFEANSAHDLHRQQHGLPVDKLPSQSLLSKDSGVSSGRLPSNTSSNTSASVSAASLASPTRKSANRVSSSNGVQLPPSTRRGSQSETIGRRPVPEQGGLNISQGGSKSALIATASQPMLSPGMNTKNFTDWAQTNTAGFTFPQNVAHANMDANAKLRPVVPSVCGLPRQPIPTTPRRGVVYEAALLPPESEQVTRRPDSNHNLHFPPRTLSHVSEAQQQQPIYRPPVLVSDNSVRVINSDNMGGSRITQGPGSSEVRLPTSDNGPGCFEPYIIPQSPRAREQPPPMSESHPPPLNSDRVCPVCNRDYSHVSMEDFQTHVFECFEDDGPETMKAVEPAERACPMCNKKFRGDLPQHEFEAHVHSHFGEESFEMLHRE